ncbi:MAG: hypothetical protein ACTSW1_18545 [Candidatus Hodarchaeales archaeon]
MYEEDFSDRSRLILVIVALFYGVFNITLGPIIFQMTWQRLMERILSLTPSNPALETAPFFHTIWFSIVRSISVLAGITLIVIAYNLWKKDKWAYPLSLMCIALPIMLNVVLAIPHLAQGLGMAPNMIIILVGLICYWIFVLLKNGTTKERITRFVIFTLLGAITGQINILVLHGTKNTLSSGLDMTLFNPEIAIYTIEAPVNLYAMVMFTLSIYLLASENIKGYYLAIVGGVAVFFVNLIAQIIRMQTFDFLGAAIFALILVILLLVPQVKESLLGPTE